MTSRPLRVIVVEDEPASRAGLVRLLHREPGVEVVAEAADVAPAIAAILEHRPDAVFLDIRLPSGSGFDIVEALEDPPEVVFVTAHDEHAVAAFELAAVDYILKPYSRERLQASVERLREGRAEVARDHNPVAQARATHDAPTAPFEHLYIRRGRRILVVPVREIVRVEADGMYTRFFTEREVHVATIPLNALVQRLPAAQFQRVHRGHIVNLAFVSGFAVMPSGRLEVQLTTGATVPCSREHARQIRGRTF